MLNISAIDGSDSDEKGSPEKPQLRQLIPEIEDAFVSVTDNIGRRQDPEVDKSGESHQRGVSWGMLHMEEFQSLGKEERIPDDVPLDDFENYEDMELLLFSRRVAAIFRFLHELKIESSLLEDYDTVPQLIESFFVPQRSSRKYSLTLADRTIVATKPRLSRTSRPSEHVRKSSLNLQSLGERGLFRLGSRANLTSTIAGAGAGRKQFPELGTSKHFLTDDESDDEPNQNAEGPDLAIEQPLMQLINQLSLDLVADDGFYQHFINSFQDLQLSDEEVDMTFLNRLYELKIDLPWISSEMKTRNANNFIETRKPEYMDMCTRLLEDFTDMGGSFFFGKLRAYVVFWRASAIHPFVEYPFLAFIDNFLAFMVNCEDYDFFPVNPISGELAPDSPSSTGSFSQQGNLAGTRSISEELALVPTHIRIQESISYLHDIDKLDVHDSRAVAESVSESEEPQEVSNKILSLAKLHFFSGLFLLLIGIGGIGIIWFMWSTASGDIVINSFRDFTAVSGQGLSQLSQNFELVPSIILSGLSFALGKDTVSISSFSTISLGSTENFLAELSSVYSTDGILVGRDDGHFLGCVRNATDSYFFILVNNTESVAYIKYITLVNGEISADSTAEYEYYGEYETSTRPWYNAASNSNSSFRWSESYVYGDGSTAGISLSTQFQNSTEEPIGYLGVDLSFTTLTNKMLDYVEPQFLESVGRLFTIGRNDGLLYFGVGPEGALLYEDAIGSSDELTAKTSSQLLQQYNLYSAVVSTEGEAVVLEDATSIFIYIDVLEDEFGLDLLLVSVADITQYNRLLLRYNLSSAVACGVAALTLMIFVNESFKMKFPGHSLIASFCPSWKSGRSEGKSGPSDVQVRPDFAGFESSNARIQLDPSRKASGTRGCCSSCFWGSSLTCKDRARSCKPGNLCNWFTQSIKKSWPTVRYGFLLYGVRMVCLITLIVWSLWFFASSFTVKNVADRFLDQSVLSVVERIEEILSYPPYLNQMSAVSFENGVWGSSNSEYPGRDAYFHNTMESFRFPDGNFMVFGVYAAFAGTGMFTGAQQYTNDNGEVESVIVARDSATGYCYNRYRPGSNGQRNVSIWENAGCLYDPRSEDWYTQAIEKRGYVWSPVYKFESGEMGITLSAPFYNSAGVVLGVFATDIDLAYLSHQLAGMDIASTTTSTGYTSWTPTESYQWIMTSDALMIATSHGETADLDGAPQNATIAQTDLISETSTSILYYFQDLDTSDIVNITSIPRSLEDPLTYLSEVRDDEGDLLWIVVICVPSEAFYGPLIDAQALTFLFGSAAVALVFYISYDFTQKKSKTLNDTNKKQSEVEESELYSEESEDLSEFDHARIKLGFVNPRKTELSYWKKQMDFVVKHDLIDTWKKQYCCTETRVVADEYNGDIKGMLTYSPVPAAEFVSLCIDKSNFHIHTAAQNRDVLYIILLNSLDRHPYVYQLYRFTRLWIVRFLVNSAIFLVHLSLGIAKENTPALLQQHGTKPWILMAEGVVLFIELFETISAIIILRTLKRGHQETYKAKIAENGVEYNEYLARTVRGFMKAKYLSHLKRLSFCLVLLIIVTLDWLAIMAFSWSIEYYIPIRVLIPFFLNEAIRSVTRNFWNTIRGAKAEFLLYFSSVVFAAITASILFRTTLNPDQIENSYRNIIRSITTSFVFFSTGENYTELVYSAFETNPLYVIYYVSVTIMGSFIVGAFVLSSFVSGFTLEFQSEMLKAKHYQRSGLIASFLLLDVSHTSQIPMKVLKEFYNRVNPAKAHYSEDYLLKYRTNRSEFVRKCRDLRSFVEAMEDLIEDQRIADYNRRYYDPRPSRRMSNTMQCDHRDDMSVQVGHIEPPAGEFFADFEKDQRIKQQKNKRSSSLSSAAVKIDALGGAIGRKRANLKAKVFNMIGYQITAQVITFFVILQAVLLTFYGLASYDEILDIFNVCLICIYALELIIKLYAFGLKAYLTPTDYQFAMHSHFNLPEYQVANRIDFFAIIFSVGSVLVAIMVSKGLDFSGHESLRFGMAFSVIRIFSQVSTMRRLLYPILVGAVLRQFANLFVLLLLVMYVFAYYGMLLFHNMFKYYVLLEDTPQGTFDSLTRSFLLLFQLLVGEGWHEVMYAGVRVQKGFVVAWYFILFIVVVTLLFTNIFVSLVLVMMEKFRGSESLTRREFEKKLLQVRH